MKPITTVSALQSFPEGVGRGEDTKDIAKI